MKYTKIIALLGLTEITFHSNLFGTKQPYARLSEEDLDKLENALQHPADNSEELKEQINQLTEANESHQENATALQNAVNEALAVAGLEKQNSLVESIALLGAKCKEYGGSTERHSFPNNNGKEEPTNGLINGYLDPNDSHNQLLNDLL